MFASTSEEAIKASLADILAGTPIEQITPTTHAGLVEVVTPRGILYTDSTGSFVIFGGTMVDPKTKVNLTEQRIDALSKFDFAQLPFDDAIKTVRGDGSRVMATFEDPNCGYCKKLMHDLVKIDNLTVYTFLAPILAADSELKAKAIWCAPDRSKAWTGFMLNNTPLPANVACDTPLARNLELFKKLRLTGTPGIRFANNEMARGYLPIQEIEAKLAKKNQL